MRHRLTPIRWMKLLSSLLLIIACSTKNGEYREYDGNGNLWRIENYKDGELHGWKSVFLEDGNKIKSHYKEGKLHGPDITFYPNGDTFSIQYYKNGIENGVAKVYHKNKDVAQIINWKDGMSEGEAFFFYENGQLAKKGQYHLDAKTGKWLCYDEAGNLEKVEIYEKGRLVRENDTPRTRKNER